MDMFINKAASCGLQKLAKDVMNDIQEAPKAGKSLLAEIMEISNKYFPEVDDEELLKREKIPTAKSLLPVIYKYAPGLRGKNVGLDDDLTDEAKWNEPWNDETKKLALVLDSITAKNKKEEKQRLALRAEAFNRPRFLGLAPGDEDYMWLGMDLENKYGVDLSDTDGAFYKAKSVNDILAALKNAPRLKEAAYGMFKQSDLNNKEIGAITGGSGGTILGVLSQLLDNRERNAYLQDWNRWSTQVSERRHEAFEKLKRAVKAERHWNKELERAKEFARTGRQAIITVPQPEPGAVGKALSDYNRQRSQWADLLKSRKTAFRNINIRKLKGAGKAGLILGGVGLLSGYGAGALGGNSDGSDTSSDKKKPVNKPTTTKPVNKPIVHIPISKPTVNKPVNKEPATKPVTKTVDPEEQSNFINQLLQPGAGTFIRGAGGMGLGYLFGERLGNGALGAGLGGLIGLTPEILEYTPKIVDAVKNMFSKGAAANAGRIAAEHAYYRHGTVRP